MTLRHKQNTGKLAATAVASSVMATLASARPRTMVGDVITIDRTHSRTGLYLLDGSTVKPLNEKKLTRRMSLLARTNGLSDGQKEELATQNVAVLFIRECSVMPQAVGVVSSEAAGKEPDNIFGTVVVPYVLLNVEQAGAVEELASKLPEPEKTTKRKQKASAESVNSGACFAPFAGC